VARFEEVLKKLVEDAVYRDEVARDPDRLTKDFQQQAANDMLVLMQVWLASGHPDASASIINLCHCCCCCRVN
jgi:hypothetical protein